jgi:hypothetical protein
VLSLPTGFASGIPGGALGFPPRVFSIFAGLSPGVACFVGSSTRLVRTLPELLTHLFGCAARLFADLFGSLAHVFGGPVSFFPSLLRGVTRFLSCLVIVVVASAAKAKQGGGHE